MVDDCHATGLHGPLGAWGRRAHAASSRADVITGTLGKAMGGAIGGFTAASKRSSTGSARGSRPYLFSNTLAPVIAATSLAMFDVLEKEGATLRARLWDNAAYFREKMSAAGFELLPGDHAIIPVMLGDAKLASEMADRMLTRGIYVVGFSYPVVPKGQARIRTQMSAALEREHLDRAVDAFVTVGRELEVVA